MALSKHDYFNQDSQNLVLRSIPVGTGTTEVTETQLKLLTEAQEKRKKYPPLYLTPNFHSPTRTAIGQAQLEAKTHGSLRNTPVAEL